jgi:L-ribulose-5-phosphate 3-epimerase
MTAVAGHANSYHTYDMDTALEGVAAAGFRYIELSAVRGWTEHVSLDATAGELTALAGQVRGSGLTPSALSGHSDLTTDEGLARGVRALELCTAFGVDVMNTAIGGHAHVPEDLDAFLSNVAVLADEAAGRGVTVALEVHGDTMATGRQAVAVVDRIGRDNVRVNYDTGNCVYYGGVDPAVDVPGLAPHLAHVHLKDKRGGRGVWDFPALGDGELDLRRIIETLRSDGFEGPWSVEIEFTGEPWPPAETVHAAMRRSYAELERLGLVAPHPAA